MRGSLTGNLVNKKTLETLLFACRWLLWPFYVALVVALLALLGKVGLRAYGVVVQFATITEEDVILAALGIVDLTLTASLIVLVIFSGYANFISRIDLDDHPNWPSWMAAIDFSELKLKLLASIVAISAIKLLEVYMNVDHQTDRQLYWQAGLYGVFVLSALASGIAEWLGHLGQPHDKGAR
jgi:uncharacterized protein (TIGR00645 family)